MNSQANASQLPVNITAVLLGVFYLSTSYTFYNLNHYKLLLAWGSCLLLLTLLWGGDSLGAWRQAQRGRKEPSLRLVLVSLLPLLATLPGLLLSEGRYAYFFGQEAALWLICCGWMLLLIRLLHDAGRIASFLQLLALIVIAIAALALWGSIGDYANPQEVVAQRESGTFGNPNYLACFLAMHIPLFALCALCSWQSIPAWRESFSARVIFLAAALMALCALFFTQSRVAMATLAAVVGGLVVLVMFTPALFPAAVRKTGGVVLALLLMAGMACVWLFPAVIDALTSTLRSTPESRLVPWRAAWSSIQEAPWFGSGAGSSYSLFFQYVDPASRLLWHERSYAHPHNELLEILQEGGVLGLLGYLVFIGGVVGGGLKLLRSPTLPADYKVVVIGIGCALVVYHLTGLASVDSRMAVVRFGFFTLLAVLFCLLRIAGEGERQPLPAPTTFIGNLFGGRSTTVHAAVLVLLATSAALLGEDLASRHRYVRIMQQTDIPVREQSLQTLRDENPNVYALVQLVQYEIARGDFANAAITLTTLDNLIPHYSISGYFRAVNLLLQNRQQEAKLAALAYQQRDWYFPQNAYLLARIAVMQDEPELFLQQLQLLLTPLLRHDVGLEGIDAFNVSVTSSSGANTCQLIRQGAVVQQFSLSINEQVVADIMQKMQAAFAGPDPDAGNDYQDYISAGVNNLGCAGLSGEQHAGLRHTLLQLFTTLATRSP